MRLIKNIKENIILYIGIAIRVVMPFFAYDIPQHDVWQTGGHFDYAMYIMNNMHLANTNIYEFHQPPINAIMQAIFTKNCLFFNNNNLKTAYSYTIWLTVIYSIITLIIIKKILDIFSDDNQISKFAKNFILIIMSIYPGMLIMSIQLGNDQLATMFFYLSFYFALKWFKNQKLLTIISLALSIGFGMLTKVSVGIIALIIGPMMLYKFIKNKKVFFQLIFFAIIVFPLGLCYELRNFILFDQLPGTIYEIAKGTRLELNTKIYTLVDRFLCFPVDRLFNTKSFIYHNPLEWNAWIDLIKTSTFDEIGMDGYNGRIVLLDIIIYIFNIIYFIASVFAIILCIIKKKLNNIFFISVFLLLLAIISYFTFNIKYPYSCNSNWRYIPYITFAQALIIGLLFNDKKI